MSSTDVPSADRIYDLWEAPNGRIFSEMSTADFISYMEALSPMERSRLQDRVRLLGMLQKGRALLYEEDDYCDDE